MRNIVSWIVGVVAALGLLLIAAGQLGLLQGKRPGNLGVKDGRLKPPSRTPNSVSSQARLHADHPQMQYAVIEPLAPRGDAKASMAALRALVEAQRGATVIEQRDDYLLAEFSTRLLRFTDDVEFWFDASAGVIHVRSSSRLGRKDFGVNRERIERLRAGWVAGWVAG